MITFEINYSFLGKYNHHIHYTTRDDVIVELVFSFIDPRCKLINQLHDIVCLQYTAEPGFQNFKSRFPELHLNSSREFIYPYINRLIEAQAV